MRAGVGVSAAVLGAAVVAAAGCELQEITLVEADDVVVAEVYVELGLAPYPDRATAFLHRTLEGATGASRPVPGARVVLTRRDGYTLEMAETGPGRTACARRRWTEPARATGPRTACPTGSDRATRWTWRSPSPTAGRSTARP